MLGKVGLTELSIILFIALLIFGPKQIPRFGKAIGETIKSFKGIRKDLEDVDREVHDTARAVADSVKR